MSITDELREWGNRWEDAIALEIKEIADRIDAEHEAACAEAYGNGVMSVPIALDESAWVELPKDADGMPIHVGDVMEWIDLEGKVSVTCTAEAVGVDAFIAWDKANGRYAQKCATAYRHYHAPTVEDVLREFFSRYVTTKPKDEDDAILAEYAAKLRLAKEDA